MINEKQYAELRQRLAIDKMRLDDELMQTPMLLQTASELAADASALRDAAKLDYDITCAKAARRIRASDEKVSESKVAAVLMLEKDVQEAQQTLDDTKRDMAYWQSLADAMREKASLLRRIAELIVSGYLTQNTVYEERKQEMNTERRFRRR